MNIMLMGGSVSAGANLGDALMLYEVVKRCQERIGERVHFIVREDARAYREVFGNKFTQVFSPPIRRRNPLMNASNKISWLIGDSIRQIRGEFREQNIQCVLNFMGYRNGDIGQREGLESTRRDASDVKRWRAFGSKIIMLPQAFGPFQDEKTRRYFEGIASRVDRIFCRDGASLGFVNTVLGHMDRVARCPDITTSTDVCGYAAGSLKGCFAIVPNLWMLDRVSHAVALQYIERIKTVLGVCREHSVEPVFVIHAPFQDESALRRISSVLPGSYRVFREPHPLKMKAELGLALGIFASRYHAILAGLTQSVPTFCSSWSHKYDGVVEDYSSPFLLDDNLGMHLREYVFGSKRYDYINFLRERNGVLRRRVEMMWSDVWHCLEEPR